MASFLDNSGDILLDAVLTDIGRLRLSQGNFSIVKYAFGDDAIQYGLYNKDHPSGSAYYDLEILQTPVLQSSTLSNANINYGLKSLTRNDILYMPVLKQNEKTSVTIAAQNYNDIVYVAVNNETRENLNTDIGSQYGPDIGAGKNLIIESGIDSVDLKATAANRSTYLLSVNMLDTTFNVYADSRFISSIAAASNGTFTNTADGTATISFGALTAQNTGGSTLGLANYNTYTIPTIADTVYYYSTLSSNDTTISAIAGPRGQVAAMAMNPDPDLQSTSLGSRSSLWSQYGKIDQTPFSGITTVYDYIDTMLYVVGTSTSAQIQLPVRIIRYVSG